MQLPTPESAAPEVQLNGHGLKVGIVVARFNQAITAKLLKGAEAALYQAEVNESDVDVLMVPGAFEIPLACQHLAKTRAYDALVSIGCVIRGDTPHFDYVCQAATDGITRVSLDYSIPIGFGVITVDTPEQALARAGGTVGNKGAEAALAALEMALFAKAG
jgi:6,7-dimethyl-8-ribityllumazine synthase